MNAHRTTQHTIATFALTLAALLAAGTAAATPPTAASTQLVVECRHPRISQAESARLFGTQNAGHAYAQRKALYAKVARACDGRRYGSVLVIVGRDAPAPLAHTR